MFEEIYNYLLIPCESYLRRNLQEPPLGGKGILLQ